jgi:hypothetical protein
VEIAGGRFREAVEGKMRCLEELRSPDAARAFLSQVSREALDFKALEDNLDE